MPGILPYIGGKNRLANEIIALFPPHHTYVEVFAGGASILFRKQPSKVEILNDLDRDVTNLFRVCQLHHDELIRYMRWMLSSREWFGLLDKTDTATLTDIQRAARTIYLQKNGYAGLVRHHSYNPGVLQASGFNIERLPQIVQDAHVRLARVQIESLPYEQVLKRYDRDTTLFFLDPPYYGRKLYSISADEVQNLVSADTDFDVLFSEVRKFGVGLVTANQFLAQLPIKVRSAIGAIGTRVFFQLSAEDAAQVVQELDAGKSMAERLRNLPPRHFIVKSGNDRPVEAKTPQVYTAKTSPKNLVEASNALHARRREEIEQDIRARRPQVVREVLDAWD